MDEDHKKMKPDLLRTFLMLGAMAGQEPRRDESIPEGWECNGCGGTWSHRTDCNPPRSLKKSEA